MSTEAAASTTASGDSQMALVILIMLSAGIIGGTINFFLAAADSTEKHLGWAKCAFVSVGAAFLIPLLLNTISSDLLQSVLDAPKPGGSALVFAGFCLLAAITSRAFIQTLSDKVLSEVREAKKQAAAAKNEAEQATAEVTKLEATLVEPEMGPLGEAVIFNVAGVRDDPAVYDSLDKEDRRFIRALNDSRFRLRSVSGLASQLNLPNEEVIKRLLDLESRGLVVRSETRNGDRWAPTHTGLRSAERN